MWPSCRSPVVDVPDGSSMRIEPPGDDGRCSTPLGTTNSSSWVSRDDALRPASLAQCDVEPSVEHEEQLVGVVVHMPYVLTPDVGDADVVVVHPGDDPRTVDVVEPPQRLPEIDWLRLGLPRYVGHPR